MLFIVYFLLFAHKLVLKFKYKFLSPMFEIRKVQFLNMINNEIVKW